MGKKTKKWKPLLCIPDCNTTVHENVAVEAEEVHEMLNGAYGVIEKTVAKLYGSSNLGNHPFFFIHTNAYVLVGTRIFYPCEIAVLKFSLQKGIEDTYHRLINPGSLPVGFAHDVQSYSEVTHRVPYPPLKEAKSNLPRILDELQQFVWGSPKDVEEQRRISQFAEEDLCLPPMYTFYDKELFHYDFVNEAVTFDLMQKLTTSSDTPCRFLIHPLTKLFFELHNMGAQNSKDIQKWMSLRDAEEILVKDSFLYKPMLGCEFHEKIDAPACCSLSLVKRWALTVSNQCAVGFQIPGHLTVPNQDKEESSMVTSRGGGNPDCHGHASEAQQDKATSRHRFPPRAMPKLRQPYVSIQDKKPYL